MFCEYIAELVWNVSFLKITKRKLEQLPRMPTVIGAVQDVLLGDGWEG
jgi:hypothetical protein